MRRIVGLLFVIISLSFPAQYAGQNATPKQKPDPAWQATQPAPSGVKAPPPEAQAVFRITTSLVQVDAVVTDSKGRPVTNLAARDFEILEDGKPQEVMNCAYVATNTGPPETDRRFVMTSSSGAKSGATAPMPQPVYNLRPQDVRRTTVLLIDDLGLSFETTAFVRQALKKFVETQVQPGELLAIMRTSAGIGALQPFTNDKTILAAAAEAVQWSPLSRAGLWSVEPVKRDQAAYLRQQGNLPAPPTGGQSEPFATDESAAQSSPDYFKNNVLAGATIGAMQYIVGGMYPLPGRKSLIVLSDGLGCATDPYSNYNCRQLIDVLADQANRSGVVVHAIDARGLQVLSLTAADDLNEPQDAGGIPGATRRGTLASRSSAYYESQEGLNYLTAQTGGLFLHNVNDLNVQVDRILGQEQGYYLLGYKPVSTFEKERDRAKFHKIEVRVKTAGLTVRWRRGFFGVPDTAPRPRMLNREERLSAAMVSPFASADIRVRLTCLYGQGKKFPVVRTLVHMDGRDFRFSDDDQGRHRATVQVSASIFGADGTALAESYRTYHMTVQGNDYQRDLEAGFLFAHDIPVAKPGGYQVRAAVRDAATDRVGSATQFVIVPDLKQKRLALSTIVLDQTPTDAGAASDASGQMQSGDPRRSAAGRLFRASDPIRYAFQVFNAKREGGSRQPRLDTRLRLFREAKLIYESPVMAVKPGDKDQNRLLALGKLQFAKGLPPGDYILQAIVTDNLAPKKYAVATQWMDFHVSSE